MNNHIQINVRTYVLTYYDVYVGTINQENKINNTYICMYGYVCMFINA